MLHSRCHGRGVPARRGLQCGRSAVDGPAGRLFWRGPRAAQRAAAPGRGRLGIEHRPGHAGVLLLQEGLQVMPLARAWQEPFVDIRFWCLQSESCNIMIGFYSCFPLFRRAERSVSENFAEILHKQIWSSRLQWTGLTTESGTPRAAKGLPLGSNPWQSSAPQTPDSGAVPPRMSDSAESSLPAKCTHRCH